MISDGIENCLQYLDNFDPVKSKNPFAYFTQIIFYAFVRRIQKEKKQVTIKHKLIMDNNLDDFALQPQDNQGEYTNKFIYKSSIFLKFFHPFSLFSSHHLSVS